MGFINRGQSTTETIMILAVGLILLTIFFSAAWQQVSAEYVIQQEKIGSQSLRLLKAEVEDIYFLGAGEKREIVLTLPDLVDYNQSYIRNNSLVLKIGDNNFAFTTSVPVRGEWPSSSGQWLVTITSFGDFVLVSTSTLSFSPAQINESLNQGTSSETELTITNTSTSSTSHVFSINGPSSGAIISSSDTGTINLSSAESTTATITTSCPKSANGDYNGELVFASDANITYPIFITCLSAQSKLSVFPQDKNIYATENIDTTDSMTVCNSSAINFTSSSATISSTAKNYVFSNFSSSVPANSCVTLDLNVSTPGVGSYTGTITVASGGFSDTADLNLIVGS
jgi:hypothetical protein